MIQVGLIPADMARWVCMFVEPLLQKATSRGSGGLSIPHIIPDLEKEKAFLMTVSDNDVPIAAAITRVEKWPEGRVYRILGLGGSRVDEWLPAFDAACEGHARDFGCTMIDFDGRKAWGRLLELEPVRYGFQRKIEYGN